MSIFEELLLHHVVLQSIKYSPKTTREGLFYKSTNLEKKLNF